MSCKSDTKSQVSMEEEKAVAAMAEVPHKILVMSGKGGVGKTTVAVNLAYTFASMNKKVGIIDADIHGPNVALMTGIEGMQVHSTGDLLEPVIAAPGIKVLSVASLLPDKDCPVVWRGPRKTGLIRNFLANANWNGMDVLVVDCPPGTGDEPMAVAELIPDADGVVIVTSPQDVSLLDSRKCVGFVRGSNQKLLGIVENLSGFVCPSCGEKVDLFKVGGGERAAEELNVPFLGRIPITPKIVESGDEGKPFVKIAPDDPGAIALREIAENISTGWQTGESKESKPKETNKLSEKHHRSIAIASEDDKGLDGEVSQHFGRCPYYLIAEVEEEKILKTKLQKNPHFDSHQPGQMPEYIQSLGVDVIVAGGMGPKAVDMFNNFGIEVATGATGNVGSAIDAYLRGEVKGITPCAHDHPDSCGGH